MDSLTIFWIVVAVAIVVVIALFVHKRLKMAKDPRYAAEVAKKAAAREFERQQKRLQRAEYRVKKARYEEAIAPEKNDLLKAKREYNARIDRREDELNKLIRARDKEIRDQQRVITDIEKRYGQHLATVGKARLFVDHLALDNVDVVMNETLFAEIRLGADLLAYGGRYKEFSFFEVDPEVQRASEPSGLIGGIGDSGAPWPVAVVPSLFFLFIYGTAVEYGGQKVNACIPLDEKTLQDGQNFEAFLNDTASKAQTTQRRKEREISEARGRLAEIENDTQAIDAAKAALERERENRRDIDVAQKAYEEAQIKAQADLDFKP